MGEKKLTLGDVLNFFDALTDVTLYVNSRELPKGGNARIYDFPDRHDINQFYGCEVEEISPSCFLL